MTRDATPAWHLDRTPRFYCLRISICFAKPHLHLIPSQTFRSSCTGRIVAFRRCASSGVLTSTPQQSTLGLKQSECVHRFPLNPYQSLCTVCGAGSPTQLCMTKQETCRVEQNPPKKTP